MSPVHAPCAAEKCRNVRSGSKEKLLHRRELFRFAGNSYLSGGQRSDKYVFSCDKAFRAPFHKEHPGIGQPPSHLAFQSKQEIAAKSGQPVVLLSHYKHNEQRNKYRQRFAGKEIEKGYHHAGDNREYRKRAVVLLQQDIQWKKQKR